MNDELQGLKEDIAQLGTRMSNVEGYFDNFNTTLTNHMEDYRVKQEAIDKTVSSMEGKLTWAFWVIFSLLLAVVTGFVASTIMLLGALL